MNDSTLERGLVDPTKEGIKEVERKIADLVDLIDGTLGNLGIAPMSPTMGFVGFLHHPQTETAAIRYAMVIMHMQTAPTIKGGFPGIAMIIDPPVGARSAPVKEIHLPRDHSYFTLDNLADADRLSVLETYYGALEQAARRD